MPKSISCPDTARPARPFLKAAFEGAAYMVRSGICSGQCIHRRRLGRQSRTGQAKAFAERLRSACFDSSHAVQGRTCALPGRAMARLRADFVSFDRTQAPGSAAKVGVARTWCLTHAMPHERPYHPWRWSPRAPST